MLTRALRLRMVAVLVTAFLLLASRPLRSQRAPETDPPALGPIQEVALVEDFTADRAGLWKARGGSNVTYTVRSGVELPGVAATLMALEIARRNPSDNEPSHNWFQVSRDGLPAGTVPQGIDGFRFLLGSHRERQWWISVGLTTEGGGAYTHLLADHPFPAGRMVEYTVPLEAFKSAEGETLTSAQAARLRGLSFTFSNQGTTIYLDRISAYRREVLRAWLDFSTSHPGTNLFQRTDPVELRFRLGGSPAAAARGFRYEVRDFFGKVGKRDRVRLTGARDYAVSATPRTHGYYEVRAFFTEAAGRDLEKRSCLRSEGTVPAGLGTFSVLPGTLAENTARFRKLGTGAFFGLHGDFAGLADLMGLAWRFGYTKWPALEPNKPDRSSGIAPWARDLLAQPPQPSYRLHILPFRGNMGEEVPGWAKRQGPGAPPFERWEDYLAMVRDQVRVERHLYPQLRPRLYGAAWEANLNMPPYVSQPPEHTPAQLVELFRRTREVVKEEDPTGWVLGPCPSVLNPEWLERVFRAGVLDYLDGIETHAYLEGVFSPEENDFPGKLARLRALVRRYAKGRALPIYCTELGQPGVLGAQVVYRSQAQRMTRAAIILKGEGVRVFLPFYGIDYDRAGYWGFLFNLDVDAPEGPWATRRVSPKPMVNAIAVCARLLEGAAPQSRLRGLGQDVWAYQFRRQRTTITAAWTAGPARRVSLPLKGTRRVEVVDIMGHVQPASPSRGSLKLTLSESPVYVIEQSGGGGR